MSYEAYQNKNYTLQESTGNSDNLSSGPNAEKSSTYFLNALSERPLTEQKDGIEEKRKSQICVRPESAGIPVSKKLYFSDFCLGQLLHTKSKQAAFLFWIF